MKTKLHLLPHQLPIGKRDLRLGSSLRALAILIAIGCVATSLATSVAQAQFAYQQLKSFGQPSTIRLSNGYQAGGTVGARSDISIEVRK